MVPWKTRIGDIGESEIKARLQYIATVTKIERDVGIDFYCELLLDEKPVFPFYIQAKSSSQLNKQKGRSISKKTMLYWLSRPFPVYIIFYDQERDIYFFHSIENDRTKYMYLLFHDEKKSIFISVDDTKILEKGDNSEFKKQYDTDYYSLLSFHGNPQFRGSDYVKSIPSPPKSKIEHIRIKANVRAGLYSLIYFHMRKKHNDIAINLCESVSLFDNSHYNHFAWLGYLYKGKDEFEKSLINFEEAISICKRDKIWDRKGIAEIIKRFEQEIVAIKNNMQ